MTNEQRQKIREMRYQGLGYEKIANATGLSRDSVRGYCLRNGLGGFAADLRAEYHKIMEEEFIFIFCLNCGKKIEQNRSGRKKKYCSLNCKREWEKTHRKTHVIYCDYCGKEFKSLGVKERKYCNSDCYIKDRFWREEDAAEVTKQILEFKKVNRIPNWLRELLT